MCSCHSFKIRIEPGLLNTKHGCMHFKHRLKVIFSPIENGNLYDLNQDQFYSGWMYGIDKKLSSLGLAKDNILRLWKSESGLTTLRNV